MFKPKGFKRRDNDDANSYSLAKLPSIDRARIIAVYVRQSHRDADDKNGESRATQLKLVDFGRLLLGDNKGEVRIYDEKAGKSGQKRIDERPELERLYRDMDKGIIGTIIVSREDRLFRDRHGAQSGAFTEKAEKMKTVVIVPPLGPQGKLRYYDFSDYEQLRKFQEKMQAAYDYIAIHVAYMSLNLHNKSTRGCYDGRPLPPGLVIPRSADKMEQKPVIYEPWAEKMRWVYKRWKELDYSVAKITREIERLPFLFPEPSEEDYKLYLFKNSMKKFAGGFKPTVDTTIRRWFGNVHLIGWWPVDDGEEVIVNNHDVVIDRATFEEGYIRLTGYNLDGVLIPDGRNTKKIQVRRARETPVEALLHGHPNFTAPGSDAIHVVGMGNGTADDIPRYVGQARLTDKLYRVNTFSIICAYIDYTIAKRLMALSEKDKEMAKKIEQNLKDILEKQAGECISIDDQLAQLEEKLRTARKRLARLTLTLEATKENEEVLDELTQGINGMEAQQYQLQEKKNRLQSIKGMEEIRTFYGTLSKFKEGWPELKPEQKQRLIRLLTKKIEIEILSSHWLRLTVHWIGPVCIRPDVALIWKQISFKPDTVTEEEENILRRMYPTYTNQIELRKLIPTKTWNAIRVMATRLGLRRDGNLGAPPKHAIPTSIAWEDLEIIPDLDKAIEMATYATTLCIKEKQNIHVFWLAEAGIEGMLAGCENSMDLDAEAQGREVFAVPGGIFSPGGAGVNKLIQDGAHPVTNVNDILQSLNLHMIPQQVEAQAILPENREERTLLELLDHEARHIDDIIRESALPAHTVAATLTMMELKGMVKQVGGMQYVLAR